VLSFSTEFPVGEDSTAQAFLETVRSWAVGSPHTSFTREGLELLTIGAEKAITSGKASIEIVGASEEGQVAVSVRHTVNDDEVDWVTEISFAGVKEPWVSVRTFRDSTGPIVHLPPAKKPVVIMTLLDALSGGRDGELEVMKTPHRLTGDDVDLAGRLLNGDSGCYLPVVYVSATFDGFDYLNPEILARELCGMAHVVVEPNRPFSQRLQLEVASSNAYGGAVGIYWPEGAGRHLVLPDRSLSYAERKNRIVREVRQALLNRRPLQWCSWSAAQQLASKLTIQRLRESGSSEVDLYISSFDAEMALKNNEIQEAEAEIRRLKAELRANRQKSDGSGVRVRISSEQDYYPDEISSIIRDAAADSISRVQVGSRREHVLRAVASASESSSHSRNGREKLKSLFRDYRSMTKEIRDGLADMGFSVTEDGKHYKLVYQSDDRYVFAMPKTSSDHRAGLNLASDIAKRIF
jgi:hypothetical protein